jgi:hypothetical protein
VAPIQFFKTPIADINNMKTSIASLLVVIASALIGVNPAFGWGQNGHRITAEIAQRNLHPQTAEAIELIIGTESLAEISTWPDDIRSVSSWDFSQPWHFLSINDDKKWEDLERAPEGDVVSALEELERFLSNPAENSIVLRGTVKGKGADEGKQFKQQHVIGKREALAFYVHFVGDIHQPLHVGRREDFGGNKIAVNWFGESTNIHTVWDESMIESTNLSFTELADFLDRVPAKTKALWSASAYLDWAKESKEVRHKVYDFGKQKESYYLNIKQAPKIKYVYRYLTLPIIHQRLAQGGIRLSAKLDQIFADYLVP